MGIAIGVGVVVVAAIGFIGHGVYASVVKEIDAQVMQESVDQLPSEHVAPSQQVLEQARDGLTDGSEEETDPSAAQ